MFTRPKFSPVKHLTSSLVENNFFSNVKTSKRLDHSRPEVKFIMAFVPFIICCNHLHQSLLSIPYQSVGLRKIYATKSIISDRGLEWNPEPGGERRESPGDRDPLLRKPRAGCGLGSSNLRHSLHHCRPLRDSIGEGREDYYNMAITPQAIIIIRTQS